MTAFGLSPLGTGTGPFGGPGLITVLGVLPSSNNKWVVVFDREPEVLDPQAFTSATNHDSYELAAVDPTYTATDGSTHVDRGEVVPTRFPRSAVAEQDDLDPKQIIVSSEAALEPLVRYSVDVSDRLRGVDGESFAGPTLFRFRAPRLSDQLDSVLLSVEKFRDFDYIVDPRRGETPQVYRLESSGDVGIQNAETSLRKRIFRRVFTDPGGLAWEPGYGVGVRVKALAKSGRVQELSSLIAEQIRLEPDVAQVGVEVFQTRGGRGGAFIEVDARVVRTDATTSRLVFRQPTR